MRYRIGVAALVVAVAALAGVSANPALGAQNVCDETTALITGCVDGGSVTLGGSVSQPGSASWADPGVSPGSTWGSWVPPRGPQPGFANPFECLIRVDHDRECVPQDDPTESGTPPITIRDIASFIPTPGTQQMEPNGWAVAGLPTNFYAITAPHVVEGTLLGRPADVRFTPVAYQWAYGDGSAATLATKGGTWAALGIPEFEPTPTSHVYEQLGDYTITLSIVFGAEYRFDGSPWLPVVGTITVPANELHIRVGTAKTVLVEHDCLANPSGPGC